jgi:tripeptide aminopeptidase
VIDVESSNLKILLRDFDMSGLEAKEKMLRDMVTQTAAKYPEVKITIDVKENYKNMKGSAEELSRADEQCDGSVEAGGTEAVSETDSWWDGRLEFDVRGLPTPNLFTGGGNFHGKLELNSRRGLEKTTETLVNLVQIFAEKS